MKKLIFILFLFLSSYLNAQVMVLSGGTPYCAEYQKVYDAFVTKPDATRSNYYNTAVSSLVAGGYWLRADAVYIHAVHGSSNGDALLDWKQPAGGADVVIDGEFNTGCGAGNWTCTANWTISGEKAIYDDLAINSITNIGTIITGKTYRIRYTISDCAGDAVFFFGQGGVGAFGAGWITKTNGTYELVATSTRTGALQIWGNSGSTSSWKIDNVSCILWTNATAYNSPTFTADQGFTGGTTPYIDHNWRASVNGVNYTQNSSTQIIYIRTNVGANGGHGTLGNADSKDCFINPKDASGNAGIRTNDATTLTVANADGSGLYFNTRTAAAVNLLYRNKVAIIEGTTASVGVPAFKFFSLAYNDDGTATGFRADQVSIVIFMNGCSAGDVTAISDILNALMTSLGTNVYSPTWLVFMIMLIIYMGNRKKFRYEKDTVNIDSGFRMAA